MQAIQFGHGFTLSLRVYQLTGTAAIRAGVRQRFRNQLGKPSQNVEEA
jgi:hypothetical protein